MKLFKDGQVKKLESPKAIERWIKFDWIPEGEEETKDDAPKRRGRPRNKG